MRLAEQARARAKTKPDSSKKIPKLSRSRKFIRQHGS
jgi:hypothetical protein